MTQKAQNIRPHDLGVKQPGIKDYSPENDGYKEDIVDQSDRIRIGVTDGKSGSVTSKNVTSYSRPNDLKEESDSSMHYD